MPNRLNSANTNTSGMECEQHDKMPEERPTCANCGESHMGDCPNTLPGSECRCKIKRHLMSEFSILYDTFEPHANFSSIEQIGDSDIHVVLRQYPDQGVTNDIKIYEELRRLRYFGWQLRWIKYDKESTLHLYFEKIDWRSRESYGLMPTKYNNE